MARISKVKPGVSRTRTMRSPQFDVSGNLIPHGLQTLACFPVLPGETLTRMRMKARIMSHPIVSPLAGAHYEIAAFYVKLSDLDPTYRDFFADETDPSLPGTTGNVQWVGSISGDDDIVRSAYNAVVPEYYRDAGESSVSFASGPSVVGRDNRGWFNNLGAQFTEATLTGTSAADDARELSAADLFRLEVMEETKFEDYLEQYGVRIPPQDREIPEMFYYSRAWTMPRNSVEPTTGVPASMWAWSPSIDMQKRIRFTEPGVVLLLHWVRPKLRTSGHRSMLNRVSNIGVKEFWRPPHTLDDPLAGAVKVNFSDLPIDQSLRVDVGELGLIYDQNDLWVHGEPWYVTAFGSDGDYAAGTLSTSFDDADSDQTYRSKYPSLSDIQGLFTGSTEATRLVEYDGLLVADIAGHVTDWIE